MTIFAVSVTIFLYLVVIPITAIMIENKFGGKYAIIYVLTMCSISVGILFLIIPTN